MTNKTVNKWKQVTLEDLVTISSSKRIFHSDYVKKGIPFYRSKEIIEKQKGNKVSQDLFITKKRFKEIDSKFGSPKKGNLLLTSVGTLGTPYLVKENEVFYFKDGNLTWFKDYKNLHPKFIYYFFLSSIGNEKLNEITIGSTQKALTIAGLKKIRIDLPSLPEQKAIAATLSSFDGKIELLREQNKTLEKIAQTIFNEWFGKYQVGDKLPKGWRVGKLKDVVKICGGGTPSTKNPKYWNENIYWTSPNDLSSHSSIFLFDTEKKISKAGLDKISSRLLPKNTLLLSSRAPIGYLAITSIETAINQGYIALYPCQYLSNYFMFLWLKKNMNIVKNSANGSTFLEISKRSFNKINLVIPEKNALNKLDKTLKPHFEKMKNNSEQIQTLSKTRDALLPKLMSGEIRIKKVSK